MSETWSARPFVAYDGPDENKVRAEIHVVKGFGRILKIESSSKGESNQVFFDVSNTKYPVSGWIPVNSDVFKIIQEAQESGDPIHFRLEFRRKPGIDRTIPIQELRSTAEKAKDNTYKGIAAVKRDSDSEWTISEHAQTRIDEDPAPVTGNSAYNYDLDELRALRPGGGNSNSSSSSSNENTPKGSRNTEPAPYYTFDFDGNILPGSIAVSVPLTILNFLNGHVKKNSLNVPDHVLQKAVAPVLSVCNRAQMEVMNGQLERPQLGAPSHTRARAIVFDVIENGRVPLEEETFASSEAMREWVEKAVEKTVAMWRWSLSIVEKIEKPESDED